MNYKITLRSISVVTFILCAMFATSFCVQCASSLNALLLSKWAFCFLVSFAISAILFCLSKNHRQSLFKREILSIIGLGWIAAILIGMLPYLVFINKCPIANAFFESASGFTTTGSSVFENLNKFPRSLLFFRGMTQWIGGFGTIAFFAILLPVFGAKTKSICMSGLSVRSSDTSFATIKTIIKYVFGIYLSLSIASAIIFFVGGMSKLDAICYAFSVVSTGGFTTANGDIILKNSAPLQWASIAVMMLSGMNFISIIKIIKGEMLELSRNEELKWYLAILLSSGIFITAILFLNNVNFQFADNLRSSLFQATSIMTTTGLAVNDFAYWPISTHIILTLLMICGGCSGSTSGGLKVSRIVVAFKSCLLNLKHSFRPNVISYVFLNKDKISSSEEDNSIVYIVMSGIIICTSIMILPVLVNEFSFQGIISSALANFFNIGISTTELGQFVNYSIVSNTAKYVYGMLMIIGRVEIFAVLALLFPSFWKKFL